MSILGVAIQNMLAHEDRLIGDTTPVKPHIRAWQKQISDRIAFSRFMLSLELPLTHTAIPSLGSVVPAFTRATTETGQKWDEEGYLDFTALAGEVVFKGARRETNLIKTNSEDFGVSFTTVNGGNSASGTTLTFAGGAMTYILQSNNTALIAGRTYQHSVWIRAGTKAGAIKFGNQTYSVDLSAAITPTATLTRYSITAVASGSGGFVGFINQDANTGTVIVEKYQISDITGETDQTTIRPYVSVGVESAPAYHGSMVDGVKCYDTDRSGNPITQTTTYDAVTLNGVVGTYVSTPDSVAIPTGDIDIRVKVALVDYTPAVENMLANQGDSAINKSIYWILNGAGTMVLTTTPDGSTGVSATATAATGVTDGATSWLRVTRDVDNGAGGNTTVFYKSTDGTTWTQIGAPVVNVGTTSIYNSAAPLLFGMEDRFNAYPMNGKLYQAQIYNGINGTLAVDFDASRYAGGTTLTGSTGETWTLNGNAVIHPTNYPLVGYVPWEARTNLCLQSNAFTTTWTENGGVLGCVQNVVGPDGTTSAWTFTDDSAVAIEGRAQAINLTAAAYTFSVLVKKTTGATVYPAILAIAGATFSGATIDTNSGVCTPWVSFDALTPAAGMSANCVSHDSSYWRASLTFTGTVASWTHLICPAIATSPTQSAFVGATVVTLTGSAVFYGAQVELGSFATPYIPTTTVAAARNASLLTYTGADVANIKTLAMRCTPVKVSSGAYQVALQLDDGTGNERHLFAFDIATPVMYAQSIDGGAVQSTINSGTKTAGVEVKASYSFAANDMKADFDGTAGTPDTSGTMPSGITTMRIGGGVAGAAPFNGPVNHIYGFVRNLSQSELGAIDQ